MLTVNSNEEDESVCRGGGIDLSLNKSRKYITISCTRYIRVIKETRTVRGLQYDLQYDRLR